MKETLLPDVFENVVLKMELGKNHQKNKHMADGKLKAEENLWKVNPIQIANLSINYPPPSIPFLGPFRPIKKRPIVGKKENEGMSHGGGQLPWPHLRFILVQPIPVVGGSLVAVIKLQLLLLLPTHIRRGLHFTDRLFCSIRFRPPSLHFALGP